MNIIKNRELFLESLRSGDYKKGTVHTDGRGRPIIESTKDEGYCAVGLAYSLFHPTDYRDALGLQTLATRKIQQEWNDSTLTFPQIADLVENRMFSVC